MKAIHWRIKQTVNLEWRPRSASLDIAILKDGFLKNLSNYAYFVTVVINLFTKVLTPSKLIFILIKKKTKQKKKL